MSNYIQEIAWGKRIKTKSQRNRERAEHRKERNKRLRTNLKTNFISMGKTIYKHGQSVGREIKNEQIRRGGFYNLSKQHKIKKKPKKKKIYKRVYYVRYKPVRRQK